ncbi:MAG TPA: hypothetical protein VKB41_11580 [Steroidobacteraceae bacterium]|nr:hypothetical protein [Steroidobacteraceae bacterium]
MEHCIGDYLDAHIARDWLQSRGDELDRALVRQASKHLRKEGRKALKQAKRRLRKLSN